MKKKPMLMMAIVAIMIFALAQSVMAFSDVANNPKADKINALKKSGVISGIGNDKFNPEGELTYAAGISMLVKGLDLNIDLLDFVKEPKASDTFPNLSDNAWYSNAFVIAHYNGLEIPEQVKENDPITKEQFAHHLFQAISTKGDYAFITIYIMLNDEDDVNPDYMGNVQKVLISKFASLDEDGNFYPKAAITRGEAAGWLYDGIKFVEEQTPVEPMPELPVYDLKLEVEAVNEDVNKVNLSADMPHPGYGLRINSIVFEGEQAIIYVEPTLPDPDMMYPQVITPVTISTYVDSAFKPVLAESVSVEPSVSHPAEPSLDQSIAEQTR